VAARPARRPDPRRACAGHVHACGAERRGEPERERGAEREQHREQRHAVVDGRGRVRRRRARSERAAGEEGDRAAREQEPGGPPDRARQQKPHARKSGSPVRGPRPALDAAPSRTPLKRRAPGTG
jgi:hypothetical protein